MSLTYGLMPVLHSTSSRMHPLVFITLHSSAATSCVCTAAATTECAAPWHNVKLTSCHSNGGEQAASPMSTMSILTAGHDPAYPPPLTFWNHLEITHWQRGNFGHRLNSNALVKLQQSWPTTIMQSRNTAKKILTELHSQIDRKVYIYSILSSIVIRSIISLKLKNHLEAYTTSTCNGLLFHRRTNITYHLVVCEVKLCKPSIVLKSRDYWYKSPATSYTTLFANFLAPFYYVRKSFPLPNFQKRRILNTKGHYAIK